MAGARVIASDAEPISGRELLAFATAVETASVHSAADALGLTQSAVSKRIQALERRVGTTLLERGRAGVAPTEAGRLLYPEAKQALAALERAARVVAGAREDARRDLRLAASHTIGEFLLPGWLATFRAGGDWHVQVDVTNSPAVLAAVRDGRAEVGFVEGNDALDDFDVLTLLRDELVVVVGASHPWARRREIGPDELGAEPYLARERDSGTRAVVAERLARAGVQLTPALETPSIQALKRAVVSGGFTVISEVTIAAEAQAGALCRLRIRGVDLRRELCTVRRPGRAPGNAARLWSWLRDARELDGFCPAI
jgi:DNA-binding transcriptional LysR family regulator